MVKRLLITGGTGFIGVHLTNYLLDHDYQVRIAGRKTELKGDPVDAIIHLAGQMLNKDKTFEDYIESNVHYLRRVLEFAKQEKVQRFIYVSTGSIFSEDPGFPFLNESSIPTPSSYYALTKYIGEYLIKIELKQADISAAVVRFPSVFGHGHTEGIVRTFYELALRDMPIHVYGRWQRSFLYIDDAVEILVRLLLYNNNLFEIYQAGSFSLSAYEIAESIVRWTNSKSKIVRIDKPTSYEWHIFIDDSKLKKAIEFQPRRIKAGIEEFCKNEQRTGLE